MTEPKRAMLGKWQGIPMVVDHTKWKPGLSLMMQDFPNHPDMAHEAKREADAAIYRMLSSGG